MNEPKTMSTKRKDVCAPSDGPPGSLRHRNGPKQPSRENDFGHQPLSSATLEWMPYSRQLMSHGGRGGDQVWAQLHGAGAGVGDGSPHGG